VLPVILRNAGGDEEPPTNCGEPEKLKGKRYPMQTMSLALRAMLLLAFSTICTTRAQSGATDEGIDTVEVVKATATVEKIDLEKRKVTLLLEDGKTKTYKVDSRVHNLAQVKVGDHLEMSFTEARTWICS
jgi:Cu/Ag efflux protein CusF